VTDEEVARKLWALARRWPCVNHQENELIREAARRLMRPGTTYPGVPEIIGEEETTRREVIR
jgi:hypothetical protein